MQSSKVTIALVLKTGGCYTPEYVYRIVQGIKQNVTLPHRICLLTDLKQMVVPCGVMIYPLKRDFAGWWSKLELFDNFKGKTVYFDLDTIIKGNIDWLLSMDTVFSCLTDLIHPKFIGTGVMAWNGDYSYLPENFNMDMDKDYRQTGKWGDQGYIHQMLHIEPERIQDLHPKQISSYKRSDRKEKIASSIVCYHGRPRPHNTGWAV